MNYEIVVTHMNMAGRTALSHGSLEITGSTFVNTKEEAIAQFMQWAKTMAAGDRVSIERLPAVREESA